MVDTSAVHRAYEYLLSFGVKTNWFKFKMKSRPVRCDAIRTNRENLCHRIRSLIRYDDTLEWRRGWLAGIFDAEGNGTSGRHRGIIRITNKDKEILQTTRNALDRYGFSYVEERRRRISAIRVRGGRAEYMRFFALTNIAIPRKIALEETAVKGQMKVGRIVHTGRKRLMYDLTTGTGNFVANGLVSHNCYANFMRRFSGHLHDRWGSFVDVKVNLIDVLAKELPKRRGGSVWLSSVCDPYQQPEAKYELTRRTIQLLSEYPKFTISILTKNTLILRDVDLLRSIRDRVDVGFTITTFDEKAQRIFEPHASPVNDRVKAVRQLSEVGVRTWVFIAPMLPYVTEIALEEGLRQLKEAGVKRLMSDRYNARGSVVNQTLRAYQSWNPACDLEHVRQLLWGGEEYYRELDARISNLWRRMSPDGTYERDLDWYLHKATGRSVRISTHF
jgi:DNA repair photolyase